MSGKFLRMLGPVAAALGASVIAAPASATETSFATYTGLGLSAVAVNPGTIAGSLTVTDSTVVNFAFLNTPLTSVVNGIFANLVFSLTSPNSNFDAVDATTGVAYQPGFSGSLTITTITPLTIGSKVYTVGSNLLSATFSNGSFLGVIGQHNAGLTADSDSGILVYTSDFLSFANASIRDYTSSFGAITPLLNDGSINDAPGYISSFTATPTGSFASDQIPITVEPVPEPAMWAMMLVGLSAIGLALRRRAKIIDLKGPTAAKSAAWRFDIPAANGQSIKSE